MDSIDTAVQLLESEDYGVSKGRIEEDIQQESEEHEGVTDEGHIGEDSEEDTDDDEDIDSDEDMEQGSEADSEEDIDDDDEDDIETNKYGLSIHQYLEDAKAGLNQSSFYYALGISDPRWRGSRGSPIGGRLPGVQVHPLVPNSQVPSLCCWLGSSHCLSFAEERLRECLESHKSCDKSISTVLPKRILSIGRAPSDRIQLIETRGQGGEAQKGKYAALNYCWGKGNFIKTFHSNLEAHKDFISLSNLPAVFWEVIRHGHGKKLPYLQGIFIFVAPNFGGSVGLTSPQRVWSMARNEYSAIIEYNKRSLTFEIDRLPAISGAAARFQSLMGGDYYAGIWQKFLVPGSCWHLKVAYFAEADRWKDIEGAGANYIAPSWSWASVRGELSPQWQTLAGRLKDTVSRRRPRTEPGPKSDSRSGSSILVTIENKPKDLPKGPPIYSNLDSSTDEIRLLELLPGEPGSKIRCRMWISRCLSSQLAFQSPEHFNQEYEALSYVWGDPQLCRLIWVNSKIFPVARNLEIVLENLRHPTEVRTLWIDAICINQNDMAERSSQVLLMKKIYCRADKVLIWLGEQDLESDMAFDVLEALFSRGAPRPSKTLPSTFTSLYQLEEYHFAALKSTFSQRAWWKRIWIIQEAVFAKEAELVCGRRSISWSLIGRLINHQNRQSTNPTVKYTEMGTRLASVMETAILITTLRKRHHKPLGNDSLVYEMPYKTTLDSLVTIFERNNCTDPRDRIYGLLGLADYMFSRVWPDYTKPPMSVFRDATMSIIYNNDSLNILAYVYRSSESSRYPKQGVLSWVPDFSAMREFSTLVSSSMPKPHSLYACSRNYSYDREQLQIQSWPKSSLLVDTIAYDYIEEIVCEASVLHQNWKLTLQKWDPFQQSNHLYISDDLNLEDLDDYWRALMLDVVRPIGWPTRLKLVEADMNRYRFAFLNWSESPVARILRTRYTSDPQYLTDNHTSKILSGQIVKEPEEKVSLDDVLGSHLHGWSFCKTSKGHLGWIPNIACPGDSIHVVAGSSLPLILRNTEEGEVSISDLGVDSWENRHTFFRLVGTAYIHGIMDGEAIEDSAILGDLPKSFKRALII
ncbi:hypothetical protein G7Y89_g9300 [Cudoniella acicularis]|uniref:Heterokaryon incompatibility domain-containing protein n=1 Tax=Cudoniella acicularis TaxID=354080 RepID=A0A8H4W2Q5_9HELO|nr:hypothetical protein G7Y89_g9300 [Cudoniella acicularis]